MVAFGNYKRELLLAQKAPCVGNVVTFVFRFAVVVNEVSLTSSVS